MPLFAAALGVLGGVGGAFIGGNVANHGAEQRFALERVAARQDLRREAYGNFLGTAQELVATAFAEKPQEEVFVRLFIAEARVAVVAKDAKIIRAAEAVRVALENSSGMTGAEQKKAYDEATANFLAVARAETGAIVAK
jgi:hypothetical protein